MSHESVANRSALKRLQWAILRGGHSDADTEALARSALLDMDLTGGNPNAPKILSRIRGALLISDGDGDEKLRSAIADLIA